MHVMANLAVTYRRGRHFSVCGEPLCCNAAATLWGTLAVWDFEGSTEVGSGLYQRANEVGRSKASCPGSFDGRSPRDSGCDGRRG